jgi:hypothetical protein
LDIFSSEQIISHFANNGSKVIEERQEGSNNFYGRIVRLEKENCNVKISYLNLCNKEVIVGTVCCCSQTNGNWINIPQECLK